MRAQAGFPLLISLAILTACNPRTSAVEAAPAAEPVAAPAIATTDPVAFAPEMIFPRDRSLHRPEDGVLLADGRLLLADQFSGLVLVAADGTSRSFGNLAAAGYRHSPPETVGGANGVTLEPGGTHVLLSDIYRGGIYRVDVAGETSELIHQHAFGVNMARGDRAGGIWFTQSARNSPAQGEAELWQNVASGAVEGALLYLPPPAADGQRGPATVVADDLAFANGLAIDEAAGHVYVAETLGGRVSRYRFDPASSALSERTVLLEGKAADNIELDGRGRLWIALVLRSELVTLDLASGEVTSAWRVSTPETEATLASIEARMAEGAPWLDLMTPALWSPAPGAITGMILSPQGELRYATSLGDAVIRFDDGATLPPTNAAGSNPPAGG